MQIETITPRRAIDNAFLQESITETEFETFRRRLLKLLNQADDAVEGGESEEHLKGLIRPFFNHTNFAEDHYINTKERQDLAIHNGKTRKSKVGVIIEAKRPSNKEMITADELNRKAFHEAILYYFRERIDNGNEDIKHIIITDVYNWFIFDGQDFERHFYESKKLRGWYQEWKQGQKVSSRTQFVYDHLAEFVSELDVSINAARLDLRHYRKLLEKPELDRDEQKKLVPVFKLFTPTHLLKQPFASDSNELNKAFYRELLYIMGLKEYKEKGTHYITRLDKENRQHASLIENTVIQLKSLNVVSQLPDRNEFGENEDDQLFNVAIQLLITWINRILFLKLLEAQLYKYHREDDRFRFLNHRDIKEYDGLNKLFFQVLAVPGDERSDRINTHFGHIPYLNSSLFDVADIERQTIRISELEDRLQMPVYGRSKIRNRGGQRLKGEKISALEYMLRFLDAYNFNTEGTAEVQEEAKTLINASVLGRIFEKINGYKDGSFFTPGYITEYMCRETIRRAVVQKFNDTFESWDCEDIEGVAGKISRHEVPYKEANAIVNNIAICDPAVGSGHFLVSALNELIAIKSDLRIFVDDKNQRIRDVDISVDNDELSISVGQDPFFEYRVHHSWKDDNSIERTVGPDTQRLQKALFREKNILIENCLFGVDINPNSVNICRLRLWIELLKHAYYKEEEVFKELEVLPNIDINIKQGNSLVSRFGLDADLSHILANNDELTIAEYKQAVRDYKETGNRDHKLVLKQQITSIKDSFRVGLEELHPVRQDLKKQNEILIREETKLDLFEGENKSKKEQNKIEKTKNKIGNLEEDLAELESASFYDQAFEWRFEYPEVLDEDGNFTGFDVVVGNPPYGSIGKKVKKFIKNEYFVAEYNFDVYNFFFEKSLELIVEDGHLSFITPNTYLVIENAKKVRKLILDENKLLTLVDTYGAFDEAVVETIITTLKKGKTQDKNIINVIDLGRSAKSVENPDTFLKDQSNLVNEGFGPVNYKIRDEQQKLYNRMKAQFQKLESIANVSAGLKPYETGKGKPAQTRTVVKEKPFTSKEPKDGWVPLVTGRNINNYEIVGKTKYIDYGKWLAAPRDPEIFKSPKLFIRRTDDSIKAAFDEDSLYGTNSIHCLNANKFNEDLTLQTLAILNSRFIDWYYKTENFHMVGKPLAEVKIVFLNRLPIISSISNELVTYVRELLLTKKEDPEADTHELEGEIDQLVYELYDLSEEEIGIVEEII